MSTEHHGAIPHWHRRSAGEHRLPVLIVVLAVIALQFLLPDHLSIKFQSEICGLEGLLLLGLLVTSPGRISSHRVQVRTLGIVLTSVMTLSNVASLFLLIRLLMTSGISSPNELLLSGGSIWLTNVVIFSLWFWELDRGGPGARAEARNIHPDFYFPQMQDPALGGSKWEPNYFDYLYTSFTNASAFSPTDVLPLTRMAKMLMMVQSMISLMTIGLVVARAVNILR